jgi:plastocyanin
MDSSLRTRGLSIAALLCLSLAISSCSSSSRRTSGKPRSSTVQSAKVASARATPLDGMYYSATSILSFKAGSWNRNLPAMNGRFMVSADRLLLSSDGCSGRGTYTWALTDEVLTLTKLKDSCQSRDVQFSSLEKWGVVHQWGGDLKDGQGLLLADKQHVANYQGQTDVSGLSQAAIEASLTNTSGLIFSPTVLIGTPGQSITLTISNPKRKDTEDAGHNFKINELGISEEVAYGQSRTVTVTFPKAGGLRFYCGYHARFNQQGELLVSD